MTGRPGFLPIRPSGWVLILICSIYFIVYMDRVNIGTAAHDIQAEFKLSNSDLGLVFSAYAYPYAVIQLFGGWLADTLGPRITLAVFGEIFSVATVLTGLVGGLPSLIFARALVGFGEGPGLAAATRAIFNWMKPERWSFAQGVAHTFSRVATSVTPPFVALLITGFAWRGSFFIVGALSLAWVAIWFWYFRDDPRRHPRVTPGELSGLRSLEAGGKRPRVPVRRLFIRMIPVILTDFCYGWTLFVYLNWMPSFFRGAYKLDLSSSAWFTASIFLAGIVGDTLGGIISDRIYAKTGSVIKARRNLIVGGMLASMLLFAPVLFFSNLLVVSLLLAAAFFAMELVIAPLWSVPMDIAPRYCGTASGFMNFGAASAGIISPWVFGKLIDMTGNWTLPFACSMALMLVGAVCAFWMRPDQPFVDEPADAPLGAQAVVER